MSERRCQKKGWSTGEAQYRQKEELRVKVAWTARMRAYLDSWCLRLPITNTTTTTNTTTIIIIIICSPRHPVVQPQACLTSSSLVAR